MALAGNFSVTAEDRKFRTRSEQMELVRMQIMFLSAHVESSPWCCVVMKGVCSPARGRIDEIWTATAVTPVESRVVASSGRSVKKMP